jgi:hypothetical protein
VEDRGASLKYLCTIALLLLAGCASPRVTVSVTGSPIDSPDRPRYQDRDVLLDGLLSRPLSPTIYSTPPPTFPPTWKPFDPLLAFLNAGPGQGKVTAQHLQAVQAPLMALAAYAIANPQLTLRQLQASPPGLAAQASLRAVFYPLGLWTSAVGQWLWARRSALRGLLTSLHGVLLAGPPGAPPPGPRQILYDPGLAMQSLVQFVEDRDWLGLAEFGPQLIRSLTGLDAGVVVYGKRSGGYGVGVTLTDESGTKHTVNESGYSTGNHGRNDLTLTYYHVEVTKRRVITLDAEASPLFRWAKEAAGGDLDLLERTRTLPNAMARLDLGWGGSHVRVALGSTPEQTLAGVFAEQQLGGDLWDLRMSVGAIYEYELLGYAELEATARTPELTGAGGGGSFTGWGQVTLALATLVSGHGVQGDVRLVPELLADVDLADVVRLRFGCGATFAAVPAGRLHLNEPERMVGLHHIRTHGQFVLEAQAGPVVLEWGAVIEASQLRTTARIWTGIGWNGVGMQALMEIGDGEYVGAALSYAKLSARALVRTDGEDFRVRFGFEQSF